MSGDLPGPSFAGKALPYADLQLLRERFTIQHEISQGASALVFRARDLRLGRDVALKVLRPELAESIGRDRFLDEIRIAAGLQHPNIVPVFESGVAGSLLYYVMPFVEGETLRGRLLSEGQLGFEEIARLTRAIAEGLTYAHARGVVHRDVKPENVLLSGASVLVADFGIARLMQPHDAGSPRTSAGLAIGTPGYMSPEQASGHRDLDGRSDVYSLACVVYEMLAGEPPFTGPSPLAVLARHMHETPRSVQVIRPSVPAEVDAALGRALAKTPADRPATPLALADELERAFRGTARTTPVAVPIRTRHRSWRWALAGAVTAVAVALVVRATRQDVDPTRIAIFPVFDPEGGSAGAETASYLGYVLEGSEPLRWEDGREWLTGGEAAGSIRLETARLQRLSRAHGAGYFMDGQVLRAPDSVTVILRLYDVMGDTMLARRGRSAAAGSSVAQLAAGAAAALLPWVVQKEQPVDIAGMRDRRPVAIANFLVGERHYRAAQFADALEAYRKAAADDPLFALADLRAAQAASWLDRQDVAESLIVRASSQADQLPAKYATYARGLAHYARGEADSAARYAHAAVAADSGWGEAWMLLGEVYYHLLPDDRPLDSLAESAFTRSRRAAPWFSPPLYHLAEAALRRGDARVARQLLDTLAGAGADSTLRAPLSIMVRCAEGKVNAPEWERLTAASSIDVLEASKTLASSPRYRNCAVGGFQSLIAWDSTTPHQRFGALEGLHGALMREGRFDEVRLLLNSERSRGLRGRYLYLVDAAAGLGFDAEADTVAGELGTGYRAMSAAMLWLLGVFRASRGDTAVADSIATVLVVRADSTGDPTQRLLARVVTAHATLAHGDTAAAITLLQQLRPVARRRELAWTLWDAMAFEQLTLARLLLRQGKPAAALRAASAFDSSQPVTYLLYQREALSLRVEAADALFERRLAAQFRAELASYLNGAVPPPPPAGRT